MAEISDYLQELEEQKPQGEKKIQVVETPDPVVDAFFENFGKIYWRRSSFETYDQCLEKISETFKEREYTQKDINNFLIKLEQKDPSNYWLAGLFISALINKSKEDNFEILTQHLTTPIDHLCFGNKKNILIIGNVGHRTCEYMAGGNVTIKGNTETGIGVHLYGGTILVKGNTTKSTGACMKNGKIIIEGDAEDYIGEEMEGGEIHLNGSYRALGGLWGGRIYHKNKCVKGGILRDLYFKFETWRASR